MSTAIATVRAHPDKYEKEFDAVVVFLTQYINKRTPRPSVKVASVGQNRPTKWLRTSTTHGIVKEKIELKNCSREEYDSVLIA